MKIDDEKFCAECGKNFGPTDYRRRFCSRNCSAIHSNKRRIRIQYAVADRYCAGCRKQLLRYQNKYCSMECSANTMKSRTTSRIEAGGHASIGQIRDHLKSTRPHQCVICKETMWMGAPIPLTMDHIDGNPGNNALENLRLVCANCDRQLPTFGSRNRGFGRKSRGMKRA